MELPADLEAPLVPNKRLDLLAPWKEMPDPADLYSPPSVQFFPFITGHRATGLHLKSILDACGGAENFPNAAQPRQCLLPQAKWDSATLYHVALFLYKYSMLPPSLMLETGVSGRSYYINC